MIKKPFPLCGTVVISKRALMTGAASLALTSMSSIASRHALAQTSETYPAKPVRIVVNFAAGGGVDLVARIISTGLSTVFGPTVVVENRPGAGGNIGAEMVAKAPPDGYTLLVTAGGVLNTNPHIHKQMPFDPLKDLVSITEIARIPNLLITRKDFPANNVLEFLAYLKSKSDKLSFGSQGLGTTAHLTGEMLNAALGTRAVHVPYKGSSAVMPDLLSGRLDFMFDGGASVPFLRNNELKLLAVSSEKRLASFPNTPTINETGGVPGGFVFDSSHSILAPAGTPKDIIARLNREIVKLLRTPDVENRLRTMNIEVIANSPESADANLRADFARVGDLVKKIGLKPN